MFKPFRSLVAVSSLALTVALTPAFAQQAAPVAELVKTVNIPYQQFTLANGLTVIVTLHQVDYALRYCDRVVALKAGKKVYDGPSSGLDRTRLIDIYGPEFEDVFWEGAPQ